MAEEHRCETPENHRLCANNCGFFGSPATSNLCSKCYRDQRLKDENASSAKIAVEKSLSIGVSSSSSSSTIVKRPSPAVTLPITADDHRSEIVVPKASSSSSAATPSDLPDPEVSTKPNRCSTCRKRVGLTGFRCRCGITFCSTHRYPEKHGCTFDFKAVGREAIAKENPVVKAAKLQKI